MRRFGFFVAVFLVALPFQVQTLLKGCSLEVIVDPTLTKALGDQVREEAVREYSEEDLRQVEKLHITTKVVQLVHFTNEILKKYDFSGNTFKLFVKKLKILDSSDCHHNGVDYCRTYWSLLSLLKSHSSANHDDFCLSYILTYTNDLEGHIGRAFVAGSHRPWTDPAGLASKVGSAGVCDHFSPRSVAGENSYDDEGEVVLFNEAQNASLNTGVVSFNHFGKFLTDIEAKLAFAHEIGHSFGAVHDYPKECLTDKSTGGNFLMYSNVLSGVVYSSSSSLSSCAVGNISRVFQQGYVVNNCFRVVTQSICGNGIVEHWEECDCGEDDDSCPCCYPPSHPTKACQLREEADCCPSEGSCCHSNCTYLAKNSQCSAEGSCREKSFCDGRRAACPIGKAKNEGKVCQDGDFVCDRGSCSATLCDAHRMEACRPQYGASQHEKPCELHCQGRGKPSTCRPTSEIGAPYFPSPVFGRQNRPCSTSSTLNGYCTSEGICSESYHQASGMSLAGLIIMLIALLILINILICLYCRYCRGRGDIVTLRVRH